MLKTGAAALLLLLATPVVAQTPAPPAPPAPPPPAAPAASANAAPPPEFMQAAQAFGQCIGQRAQSSDPKATPEAAASTALTACRAQRTEMETRFESWISGPGFPPEGRDIARAQFKSEMAGAEAQIAGEIRKARASGAK